MNYTTEMYVCIYNFYKLLATTAKLNRMYYMKKKITVAVKRGSALNLHFFAAVGDSSDCMKRTMGNTPLL